MGRASGNPIQRSCPDAWDTKLGQLGVPAVSHEFRSIRRKRTTHRFQDSGNRHLEVSRSTSTCVLSVGNSDKVPAVMVFGPALHIRSAFSVPLPDSVPKKRHLSDLFWSDST